MIFDEFKNDLRKVISGDGQGISSPIKVGRPSSILVYCGADAESDITVTKSVIDKAMRPEIRDENGRLVGKTGHGLTEELIIQAIKELDSPILIFKGKKEGTILVITGVYDQKNRSVVIAVDFHKVEGFTQVNSIRSLYGRDKLLQYIEENIEQGNLIAAKKQKADELLRSIGKSYPKENTFISCE